MFTTVPTMQRNYGATMYWHSGKQHSTMEHYGLLQITYVDPITGDFTTKLSALTYTPLDGGVLWVFPMKLLPPLLHKCLPT